VWDAEAFLHERLGELEAALALHLRQVEARAQPAARGHRAVPSYHTGAVPSYHTGLAAGTPFFDHLAWLLELSPRLALILQVHRRRVPWLAAGAWVGG
jgi:hypothetical protein